MPKTGTSAAPAAPKKNSSKSPPSAAAPAKAGSALEIRDNRTTRTYTIPVAEGAIRAVDLKKIKTDDLGDTGLMSYDPAFLNTASCRSAITFIDGEAGVLQHRARTDAMQYPREQRDGDREPDQPGPAGRAPTTRVRWRGQRGRKLRR